MAPTEKQIKGSKVAKASGTVKAAKASVQRYLKSTEPKLRESRKSTLLLQGISCSHKMTLVLQELRSMSAPHAKLLTKKNQIAAFETDGQHSLEFLTTKNDCALFAMGSHNKKRPNNLVIGRTFDRQILDIAELGVLKFKSMKDYGGTIPKKRIGSKPLLLFCGDIWQQSNDYRNLQNLLVDFYRGDVIDSVIVAGLDHVIVFTAATKPGSVSQGGLSKQQPAPILIHQRTYFCKLKKDASGTTPVPYLINCGPDLDLVLKRTQWAETDLYRASRQQPKALQAKKKKNKSTNVFGETIGRLHLEKQSVDSRQGRKSKALRRAEKEAANEELAHIEQELGKEKTELGKEFQQTFGFQEKDE